MYVYRIRHDASTVKISQYIVPTTPWTGTFFLMTYNQHLVTKPHKTIQAQCTSPRCIRPTGNVIGIVEVRHSKTRQSSERPLITEPEPTHGIARTQRDESASAHIDLSEAEEVNHNQSSAEQALARYRLARRNIQRRYRKKLQDKSLGLQDSVAQLQAEIQRLKEMRDRPPRNLIEMTPWKVMVEFCRLFRYGFRPPVPVLELCSDTTPHRSDIAYAQARFCQSVMAPDVQCNTGYGVKVGLENMRLVALHHENLQVELVRLERGAEDSLIAYQETTTTITANMLRQALPHLITDDAEHGWDPVALKLIGQQLQVSGTLRFDWDFSTNKVVGAHFEVDMLTPLLALLGSVEDVSSVLGSRLAIDHWKETACL